MTKSEIILEKVDAIEKLYKVDGIEKLYKESKAITPESLEINKGSLQDISRRLDERLMESIDRLMDIYNIDSDSTYSRYNESGESQ